MRRSLIMVLLVVGCADDPLPTDANGLQAGDEGEAIALKTDGAGTTYLLHVGGVCSQSFTVGSKGENGARLAQFDGVVSVNLDIDQSEHMSIAVPQLARHLDRWCTGE
ncbi:MAG: hypothetical protein KC620_09200, partial [Myxococcales bacterium]|nr:hypothetical protein [Myxococcales bacterium]